MKIKLSILIFLFVCSKSFARAPAKGYWTTRFDFQVPQPVNNKAFKTSFSGILDLGATFCFGYKGVFLGPFYRYKQFQVQANKIKNITTVMLVHNFGLKIGYDHWISDKTIFSSSINIGYNSVNYRSVVCLVDSIPHKFDGVNIEPNVNFHFMIDEGFGIGLMVSYNVFTYEFDPNPICLNQYHTYTDSDKSGLTQTFSFGFCAYLDLNRKVSSDY